MKISLAPMEGVIDFVLRDLLTKLGGIDLCTTEFIRVTDRDLPDHIFLKYCPELRTGGRTSAGVPVFVQLLGGIPAALARNAERAVALGALGVDLNFGCPAKTVNRHDGGAVLLKTPSRLYDVISAVRGAVPSSVPVTAKVRLGFADPSLAIDIAQAAEGGGASHLTVHGRTRNEGYEPPAHWDIIGRMHSAIKIPVIANGDIWTPADYLECRRQSGCNDIALGRPVLAWPDLPRLIKKLQFPAEKSDASATPVGGGEPLAESRGPHDRVGCGEFSSTPLPWLAVQSQLFIPFLEASFLSRNASFALARGKQLLRYLTRQYPEAAEAFARARTAKTLEEFRGELAIGN